MVEPTVRKFSLTVEDLFHEGGPEPSRPLRRGAIIGVVKNPFAGKYVSEISGFMDCLRPLGEHMSDRLARVLGGAKEIEGYGKGAIVGAGGELEHGALWHAPGGHGMRFVLGGAKAIVPSTKKVGCAGTRLDVPITHIQASYVRSHFDAMEVGLADSPRFDEICLILVMTTGPRIHHRSLGLAASDIVGKDGLR